MVFAICITLPTTCCVLVTSSAMSSTMRFLDGPSCGLPGCLVLRLEIQPLEVTELADGHWTSLYPIFTNGPRVTEGIRLVTGDWPLSSLVSTAILALPSSKGMIWKWFAFVILVCVE